MVELKLDTAAVNALFPEGTPARVALQQAVINNVTKSLLSKHLNEDIKNQVAKAAEDVGMNLNLSDLVHKELKGYLDRRGWSSTYPLQDSRKEEVRAAVKREVSNISSEEFKEISKTVTDEAIKRFNEGVDRKIKYALENIEGLASSRLNENFKEILDKALADRLGLAVKS